MQTSSRNDGMVHPGVDLIPGQVKRHNMRGNQLFDAVCRRARRSSAAAGSISASSANDFAAFLRTHISSQNPTPNSLA
ncbi:MAG: hypothetical protein R2881_03385 [Eubacteriales bacterium]